MNLARPSPRIAGLLLAMTLLALGIAPFRSSAQEASAPAVVIVAAPDLQAAQGVAFVALEEGLRAALPPSTDVRLQTPDEDAGSAALILTAGACDAGLCLTFGVTPPHDQTLFAPDLEAAIAAEWSLRLPWGESPGDIQIDTAVGLFGYATGDCTVLPALENVEGIEHGAIVAFYRGLCLHLQHDYPAALAVLAGPDRAALIRAGAPRSLRLLWDAYTADSHAQAFAFDRALARDTRTIALTSAFSANDPLAVRLLPELYLQRGRHRLYLYEWDRVLEDYNIALSLPEVPARAYYDRGLLYYTQNVRQAAYDDLTRYLALEPDSASRLIPLAQRYAAELAALLATPPAA